MALNKFSWREVRARPTRVLLTFLSIAIGVGAVVAVLLATSTTRSAQTEMLRAVSGKADIEIVANSSRGFSYSLLKSVQESEGVEVAIPSLNRFASLFAGESKARTQVLGIDPRIDQEIRDYEIHVGRAPESFREMLLDSSFAKSLDLSTGDKVKLLGKGGLEEFELVGLVRPSGSSSLNLAGAVYLVLPSAQKLFRAGSNIDKILVKAEEGFDQETLAADLQTALSDSVTVRQPRTSSDMARETLYATENGLLMAIAFALLIATFIIYNTFQMAVGERRKQLGILRAIGATRSQVTQVILREALWISALGALAGCGLGYWGAGFLNGATEQVLQVQMPGVRFSWLPFLVAVLLGMGIAALGALMPALRAGSVQPMEAMRATEHRHNDEVIRYTTPLGILFLPVGSVLLYLSISGYLPVGSDVVAIVLILLGFVLLIPCLLDQCSSWIVSLLRPWMGVEALLAQKQLMRHVGRSTLTIGVLFIAISTCTGMAGNIMDNVQNVRSWYARAIAGDFFIRASVPDFATGASADIPEGVGEELEAIDGIERLEPMRFVSAQSGEDSVLVVTRTYDRDPSHYFDLFKSIDSDVIPRLNRGEVVVGSVLAERRGLSPGDLFPLETERGSVDLPIAAITNDYIAGGLTLYMSMEQAAELLDATGANVFVVTAEKGRIAEVEEALQSVCQGNGLILQSYGELVKFIDNMINGVIASLWMLLALGCVIAAMGLVNTLTMNILEQTREIGMLRVVAMTRAQVRKMILSQAILLGLLGLLPGAIAGIFVAYFISRSALAVLGHDIVFHFRPGLTLGCFAFGIAVVVISSLIPAERATRLKISSALHYE